MDIRRDRIAAPDLRPIAMAMLIVCLVSVRPTWAQNTVTLKRSTAVARPAVPLQAVTPPPAVATSEDASTEGTSTDGAAAPLATDPTAEQTTLEPEEIDYLRAQYDALSRDEQDEMKAYYNDLGIDLDVVLGLLAAQSEAMMRSQEMQNTLRALDFARTPQNVLGARAKLGFGEVARPDPRSARGTDIARWIHLLVQAGEWDQWAAFLGELSEDDASMMYSAVLQSLNSGSSGLLPEEVLLVTEACPGEPEALHFQIWTSMVTLAVGKNSP
ncbi:MAG: hypothetical protein KDA28_01910, partial [Phycisphaerales bacterium]|nr:hypothetical protein [Phycisphaerales bacterium]